MAPPTDLWIPSRRANVWPNFSHVRSSEQAAARRAAGVGAGGGGHADRNVLLVVGLSVVVLLVIMAVAAAVGRRVGRARGGGGRGLRGVASDSGTTDGLGGNVALMPRPPTLVRTRPSMPCVLCYLRR